MARTVDVRGDQGPPGQVRSGHRSCLRSPGRSPHRAARRTDPDRRHAYAPRRHRRRGSTPRCHRVAPHHATRESHRHRRSTAGQTRAPIQHVGPRPRRRLPLTRTHRCTDASTARHDKCAGGHSFTGSRLAKLLRRLLRHDSAERGPFLGLGWMGADGARGRCIKRRGFSSDAPQVRHAAVRVR